MDNANKNKKLANLTIKKIFNFHFFIFIVFIQIKQVFTEYFETFRIGTLNEAASIIDVIDYYNLFPLITTDKKIYTGIPPSLKSITTSKIISFTSAVTYNENYILMACTEDYLLTKINIDDGLEIPLINYENSKFPNSACSISHKDNYVYIGINLNLENNIIKIKLTNNNTENNTDNNEPMLDETVNILKYIFDYPNINLKLQIPISPFSCEIININELVPEDSRLVCGYITANQTSQNYILNLTLINSNFNGIENEQKLYSSKTIPSFRFQRINSNTLIFIYNQYSFEISLKIEDSKYKINISKDNKFFYEFKCSNDLFYYNNQYLFSASSSTMYIKKNISNNYIQVKDNKTIKKIIGYYKEENDTLIFIYEDYLQKIKYFTIEGRSFLYEFKTTAKVIKVNSNSISEYNVSGLIVSPIDHQLLSFDTLRYYTSIGNYKATYDKYSFDKDTQILTVNGSLNDWVFFNFYFDGQINEISTGFFLENAKVKIETCLFKCGECATDFYECDIGTCRSNFALYKESDDKGCYSTDQNLPFNIYNNITNYFEKCYSTCFFCSKVGELSTVQSQNCKVCKEGYLRSYIFPGNCYPIEYPQNTSNYPKIIDNINDESFRIIDSCFNLSKYIINDTGECIDSCPSNTLYYNYYLNEEFDVSKQEESFLGLLYPLELERPPQFLFNNVCYSYCPNNTYEDKNNSVCRCKYGWHRDPITNEEICYNKKDYCMSLEYYYHTDDKECILNGCKSDYYQMNFECYKNSCPNNTRLISSDGKKCESTFKFCHIDEHYQTQCNNSFHKGYNLKYDNTNIYFKSCNESIYYFNQKTYLYKNICYIDCPEETTANDTNNRCSCNYYIYYVNEERTDYECLKETEKCWDYKRYNITDKKECVNTQEECTINNYKVYNDECISSCPLKDVILETNEICLCKYYYYNESNYLTCYDDGKTCETENYPFNMSNTKECFKNKSECIERGFKILNNICYENFCPNNSIENNNDGICTCQYYYFNNSDILTCFNSDETCEIKGFPYTNMDTFECFNSLDDCRNRNFLIFNDNCYTNCPQNTKPNNDNSLCICSNYFYTDENNKLTCFTSEKTCETESAEYLYTNIETKECFKTKEQCLNRGLKVFNFECLNSCPENTVDKNNNNICLCQFYTLIDENNILICFDSEIDCLSRGYYVNKQTKECFLSDEQCLLNNKKLFGKECVDRCPMNSEIGDNPNICECSNYFYNNNGTLTCFNSDKTCETENYQVNSDTKECFTSINDCFTNNYLYYFDNTCFKNSCPSDKISLNSITDIDKKNALISELNLDNIHAEKICICDIINNYYGWIFKANSDPPIQKCLFQCPYEYELDLLTNKCKYICDPLINYVFNDICYKNECPEGTHLNNSNPSSRECICEDKMKIDENTGLITCEDNYPELYYKQPEKCPFFYKGECCLKCPENTCLTSNNKDLAKCVDVKPNIKVYNQICIEGIDKLIENLDDNDLIPITTESGIAINAFSADASMENLIKKNPDLTFVDLGDCKKKLIGAYNLPPDTQLFIIGIDSPCLYDNSSISVFNYEIYLKNGTQIKDLSACDGTKIKISSNIKDLDSINYYKAIEFYEEGYDIYNRSNIFYVDLCAPAQDNGNDITLVDRAKYYFPKVSICNEGCIYNVIDFNNKRFICDCNADLNKTIFKMDVQKKEQIDDDESYLEYFLSLINYKIFLCYDLFFEFESFYYNAGFYISFITMLICLILMISFWIRGIKYIKVLIYKNVPTREKLKELLNKIKKRKIKRYLKKHKSKKYKTAKIGKIGKKSNKKMIHIFNDNENSNIINCQNLHKERMNNKGKTLKNTTMAGINLLMNYNNPPPKSQNILKIQKYLQLRNKYKKEDKKEKKIITEKEEEKQKKKEEEEEKTKEEKEEEQKEEKNEEKEEKEEKDEEEDVYNIFKKKDIEIYSGYKKEKRSEKQLILNKENKYKTNNRYRNKIEGNKKHFIHTNEHFSSKDNLINNQSNVIKEKYSDYNPNNLITGKDDESDKNRKNKNCITNTEYFNKSSNNNLKIEKINRINKKYNTEIKKNKNIILNNIQNEIQKESSTHFNKDKFLESIDLKIDFTFEHLIDRRDDNVEKRELNNIPYRQALRIDKRSFFQILFSVLANQIEFISLFLYRNPYSHYTLTISIYIFELLLDLTMNCFLYTDEVVSEKYHNDGNLTMITSLSLSFISNIISSIIVFLISKLTNYAEIIEAIIINVKDKKKYIQNIIRLFKYIKIRLGAFYFLQLVSILIMTYYLFIFCTVYHQSQGSIMINYIVGACTSLAISVGLTLIISILRAISIKYHYYQLFNISKYLYEHF